MEKITRGGSTLTSLGVSDRMTLRVRAPRMHVAWRSVDPVLSMDAAPVGGSPEWQEAIFEHGMEEVAAAEVQPLAMELADEPVLVEPGSPDVYVEMRAMPTEPDEALLMMVESDGVVQWFLPRNPAEQALAVHEASDEPAGPVEYRFHVPRSVLVPPPDLTAAASDAAGFGGAVVRFFKFRIVRELLDRSLDRVRDWVIENIEKRNKIEAFRRFDREAGFPEVTQGELEAMAGQRVLLMTHGIFSSLEGAFGDMADPAGEVYQHLRSVYGNRMFGWDHWTVGKEPLENALDLLTRLPAGLKPDILCHSRGGLVVRGMLEHPDAEAVRRAKFGHVGKAVFVAAANQGSQLATPSNINRLLNIYSAVGSIPALGQAGVVLKVVVGLLKVLVHRLADLPSIVALNVHEAKNPFLQAINGPLTTPTGEVVIAHANYDPSKGPLGRFLDLNVDAIFQTANDMVVPFATAAVLDKLHPSNIQFGTAASTQGTVMHTNFFGNPELQKLLVAELV